LLTAASQVIRFSLALWVGGTLVLVIAAPLLFREIASRDVAGRIFGELLRRFEAVKHVLSLLMVLAVFVRLEITRALEGSSVVMGVGIFVAVATNVYLAMVVRPRLGYMRMKTGSFDEAPPDDPWRVRFNRLHRRSTWILMLGWVSAAVALAAQR
jgi:Mn2+/Fe2+ NRAMP family transporter